MKILVTFYVILAIGAILLAIQENGFFAVRWMQIGIIFLVPISALILLRQIKQQEAK